MYYPNDIEECCYEEEHIENIVKEIKIHFSDYFHSYIETEAGAIANHEAIRNTFCQTFWKPIADKNKNSEYKGNIKKIDQ